MVVNPLDTDSSWPDKEYGPSNYHLRPEETRSRVSDQVGKDGLKQMEAVIWDPRSLYNEQVTRALESNEYSPDSILGLANLIDTARTDERDADSAVAAIDEHRDILLWALALYDKVPDTYKMDPVKGHRSLVQGKWTGEKAIEGLERYAFKFERLYLDGRVDNGGTSSLRYVWENAGRMLRVVANYLDEVTREGV